MHGRQFLFLFALLGVMTMASGCAKDRGFQRVDREEVVTTADINIQDWENAAATLSESLLNSGILGTKGRPDTLVISTFVNNTTRRVDQDRLIKKVRVSLNRAGVAQTYTSLTGEDAYATDRQRVNAFLNEETLPEADYSITLKLLEDRQRVGNLRQVAYTFQMSLTDVNSGLAVWEDEEEIIKQGNRSTVGW